MRKSSSRYGILKSLYPDHFDFWCRVQKRTCEGYCDTDLTQDKSGFLEFVEEIGPIPSNMSQPSVGRKDHSLGYVHGNFFWQSRSDNSSESIVRNCIGSKNFGSIRSDKSRSLMSAKALAQGRKPPGPNGRKHTDDELARMSESMKLTIQRKRDESKVLSSQREAS